MRSALALPEVRWAGASLSAFLLATVLSAAGAPEPLVVAVYLACYVLGGWEPLVEGLRALKERTLDVDLLMVVAAVAAAAIGQWFDGALLIVIFATSGALESVITARTRAGIGSLLDLSPETATLVGPDGAERRVPAAELVAGQTVVVRPGERIPGDGRVVDGVSEVDTAGLTGEPVPVRREAGDEVLAGTVNGTGVLRVRVLRDAADTVVAGVAAQVERAAGTKAERQLFIERVEQRYSVLVVAATVLLLTVPLLLGAPFEETLLRAVVFMIVASPCAIVLATMPPLLAAVAVAGRRGTLVKDVRVVEALAEVDAVVLDKTGTLTTGRPQVVQVTTLDGWSEDAVLGLAAAAEAGSEHVLGRAVCAHARERGLEVPPASGFTAVPGDGVRASVGGREVEVGRPDRSAPEDYPTGRVVAGLQEAGRTAVVVRVDGADAGVVGLLDEPRPGARAAVDQVRRVLGEPEVLTGDAARPARVLADRLGLDGVHAGLLASADVGLVVSEGAGALSLEAADGVLTRDPLGSLAPLVELSRRARRIARANLAFAAAVIVVLVGWDLLGTLPLVVGVAGHELSTVLVCLNGLRLLADGRRFSRLRRPARRAPSGAGPRPGRPLPAEPAAGTAARTASS